MAYDAADSYLVLFGGSAAATGHVLDDTWIYRAGTWTNISSTAGTPPPPRLGEAMTYDAADGYVVLAGGQSPTATLLPDVWKFQSGRWTELSSNGLPAGLQDVCGLQAAFDSTDNFTMFLGASCNSDATGGVAYAYRGGNWTNPDYNNTTGPKAPVPGYEGAILVNDPQLNGLVLFGGTDLYGNAAYNETVVYTAGNWTDETANLTGAPQAQVNPGAAYDPQYPGVLVFGGFQPGPFAPPPPATWVLQNTSWINVSSRSQPPAQSGSGALDWDGAINASVFFGGLRNYTWSWGTAAPLAGVAILATPSPATVGQAVAFSSTHVGGTAPYTFAWSFGDGGTSSLPSPTHRYSSAGTYLVNLTITDSLAATATANLSLMVSASAPPSIVATPNPTDIGSAVVFQANIASGPGGLTYAWMFGDGGSSSAMTPVHAYQSAGNFSVNLTATAPGGGTIAATTTIDVEADLTPPIIAANPTTPDLGQLVNFTATETSGAPPYKYAWAFGDGGVGGNLSAISHIFTTNGPFTTTVAVTDSAGQTVTGSLNLTIALNLSVLGNWSAGATPLVVGFSSAVHGGVPGFAYSWKFGDGATSTASNPAHTFTAPGTYTVEAAVTDAAGKSADANWSVYVAQGGGPLEVSVSASPQSIAPGAISIVTATVAGGAGGYTYAWSASGGSCTPQSILVDRCSGSTLGSFTVTLSVKDPEGTTAEGTATVQVSTTSTATHPTSTWGPLAFLESSAGWALLVVVAILVAVAAVFVIRQRPGKSSPSDERVANPEYHASGRPRTDGTTEGSVAENRPGSGPDEADDDSAGTMPDLF